MKIGFCVGVEWYAKDPDFVRAKLFGILNAAEHGSVHAGMTDEMKLIDQFIVIGEPVENGFDFGLGLGWFEDNLRACSRSFFSKSLRHETKSLATFFVTGCVYD